MPSSTDKQSNTTSQSTATQQSAYAPQVSDLNTAFTDAMKAYGQSGSATLPTDFVANFSPEALASFRSMVNYGNNNAVPNGQAAAGTDLLTSGVNGTNGALSGFAGYDPSVTNNADALVSSANKYVAGQDIDSQVRQAMQGATETARDVTMPQISQNAALSGNTNSSRTGIASGLVERSLAENAQNIHNSLYSDAYKNGLSLAESQAQANNSGALSAANAAAGAGTNAANAGTSAVSNAINNVGTSNNVDQTNFTNSVGNNFTALQDYMKLIGSQNWGTSTNSTGTSATTGTGTSTTTSNPSAMQMISGILGTVGQGASLFGF